MSENTTPNKKAYPELFIIKHADKLLLLAVPYLVLISCLYYRGYWATLRINIFPYMGVEDIIKGIAFPLQLPLLRAIVFASAFFLGVVTLIWGKTYQYLKFVYGFGSVLMLVIFFYLHNKSFDFRHQLTGVNAKFTVVIVVFSLLGSLAINALLVRKLTFKDIQDIRPHKIKLDVEFIVIEMMTSTLIALVPLSYLTGFFEAQDIINRKKFDYITSAMYSQNTYVNSNDTLKYLGKSGNYHLFVTMNNKSNVIIDQSNLTTLILEHYDINDPLLQTIRYKQKSPAK